MTTRCLLCVHEEEEEEDDEAPRVTDWMMDRHYKWTGNNFKRHPHHRESRRTTHAKEMQMPGK